MSADWSKIRKYRILMAVPVLPLCGWLLTSFEQMSGPWIIGLATALALAGAYLVEELAWISRGKTRPCPHCGEAFAFQSFRVTDSCPHCGKDL